MRASTTKRRSRPGREERQYPPPRTWSSRRVRPSGPGIQTGISMPARLISAGV